MHKRLQSQLLHLLIAEIEACHSPFSCGYVAEAILHIRIQLLQRAIGRNQRKIPPGPIDLAVALGHI